MPLIADDKPGDEPPAGGKGKKILGLPRGAVFIGGFVMVAAVAWIYFRRKQAASSTTAADGSSGGSIVGYDANGNPIYSAGGQMPADFAGEISTLQSEYGNLASEISAWQGGTPPATTTPPGNVNPGGPPTNITPPPKTWTPPPWKPKPPPKPAPKPAPPKTTTVTVAKWTAHNAPWNSTLSGIAAHYHTTVANLLKLNPGIRNPNLIYAGQKIKVP